MDNTQTSFCSVPIDQLLDRLKTTKTGLSNEEAAYRLQHAPKLERHNVRVWELLADQFGSPIIILLFASSILSFFLNDQTNAAIILFILVASGLLGFWQEWSAADAVKKLLSMIESKANVVRDGVACSIPVNEIVDGDIVVLATGDVIPGDGRLIESRDLYVNESALTGESFPVEKATGVLADNLTLGQRTNCVFLGTHVLSGSGLAVIVGVGADTEFGRVSQRLGEAAPESGFEKGLKNFGFLLIKVAIAITTVVFICKITTHTPLGESLLLALSLAVGMTPQLLPAITAVVMAAGAKAMAEAHVIVKQLIAIENFGSMTVLCSDKTGTLTEGVVTLHACHDVNGNPCDNTLRLAVINARLQSGFTNPIDQALCTAGEFNLDQVKKLDEAAYDFSRRRLSVLVDDGSHRFMITKGAMAHILECCTTAKTPDGQIVDLSEMRSAIDEHFLSLSNQGFRVLGLATREWSNASIKKSDECDLTFVGFVVLSDPPKPGIDDTLNQLRDLGISLKIITGDNRIVAAALGRQVGIKNLEVITGHDLKELDEKELSDRAAQVDLFAEVEPNQKEQIIRVLKKSGQVVGYMGDGINDASALHAADVGISVATAVDVAKEAAQVILLEHDLSVLIRGVREGRRTFANTLKYVFFVVAGNFGYMFSLAVASIFMRPFLISLGISPFDEPLLPGQILLVNLLADFPAMALASDSVDPELTERPRKWDVRSLTQFMIVFGLCSSCFDFVTFGISAAYFRADEITFHTIWFIESVLTGLLIMFVVRTPHSFFLSRPGALFLASSFAVGIVAILLPYSLFARTLGFTPLSLDKLQAIGIICVFYGIGMEIVKFCFHQFRKE